MKSEDCPYPKNSEHAKWWFAGVEQTLGRSIRDNVKFVWHLHWKRAIDPVEARKKYIEGSQAAERFLMRKEF